jgi:hypothetical protein
MAVIVYVKCKILCDLLQCMYYSSQNMVDNVQSWPEYNELREILQNMVGEVQRIMQLVWEVSLRGNVFNNWTRNRIRCLLYSHPYTIILRNST